MGSPRKDRGKLCSKCDAEAIPSSCWCREHVAEYMREYRRKNGNKQYDTPEQRAKQKARTRLNYAISKGKIIRPDKCNECKNRGKIEAHHTNYEKPYDVIWLCRECHRVQHKKEGYANGNNLGDMSVNMFLT